MREKLLRILYSPYFSLYVVAVINLIVAYFFVEKSFAPRGDAYSYRDGMLFFQGLPTEDPAPYNRLLTSPLMLYSSLAVSFITGGLFKGLLTINLIFYLLIIYVFYQLALRLYSEKRVAIYASLLLFSNYVMFNYGTNFIADLPGWFFFVLATFCIIQYVYKPQEKKWFWFSIAASSIGFLFKEFAILGLVNVLCILLVARAIPLRAKIKEMFIACISWLPIPLMYHLYFYCTYKFSYLDWYTHNIQTYITNPESQAAQYSVVLIIKVVGWLYVAGWPIFLYGAWKELVQQNRERLKLLLALIPGSCAFLAWPSLNQRVAFVLVPLLALVSGFGLSKIRSRSIAILYIIMYIVTAYSMRILMRTINLPF